MRNNIFDLMRAEDLTHMQIQYDWRTGNRCVFAAKEWEKDIDWTNYNKTFSRISLLTSTPKYYGNQEVRALFAKHGIAAYLEEVLDLMAKGRNYMEDLYYWEKGDVRFANNIHSVRRGLNNRWDCVYMGAMRRHVMEEEEIEMLVDGMNLGRAMAFKNYAAGIPMGGAKICVQQNELDVNDIANLGFLSYAIDRTGDCTGPDMRFPTNMVRTMNQRFTLKISGHPDGPMGESGTPTAFGSYVASNEAARFLYGTPSWKGKKVSVMGLGAVGFHLAKHYIEDGCDVTVADVRPEAIERLKAAYPGVDIKVVSTDAIVTHETDLLAPAAIGGILTPENLDQLKCKAIIGPGNNQIKASSPDEEMAFSKKLAERNILFQVEWWHNIAGVACAFEEYSMQDKADRKAFHDRIGKRCQDSTRENLEDAKKRGLTPTERCYKVASDAIYSEEPAWVSF